MISLTLTNLSNFNKFFLLSGFKSGFSKNFKNFEIVLANLIFFKGQEGPGPDPDSIDPSPDCRRRHGDEAHGLLDGGRQGLDHGPE